MTKRELEIQLQHWIDKVRKLEEENAHLKESLVYATKVAKRSKKVI